MTVDSQAERLGRSDQLLDMARAQEGVVRRDLQLDIGGTRDTRETNHDPQSLFGCRCPLVDGTALAGRLIRT